MDKIFVPSNYVSIVVEGSEIVTQTLKRLEFDYPVGIAAVRCGPTASLRSEAMGTLWAAATRQSGLSPALPLDGRCSPYCSISDNGFTTPPPSTSDHGALATRNSGAKGRDAS